MVDCLLSNNNNTTLPDSKGSDRLNNSGKYNGDIHVIEINVGVFPFPVTFHVPVTLHHPATSFVCFHNSNVPRGGIHFLHLAEGVNLRYHWESATN